MNYLDILDNRLFNAALNNELNNVKNLIKKGADVDVMSTKGNPISILVAQRGNLDCLKLLVEAGVDINITNPNKQTLLMITVRHGFIDCATYLINRGADVNKVTMIDYGDSSYTINSAIHIAALASNAEMIDLLVRYGADLEQVDGDQLSPLASACENYLPTRLPVIERLVKNGANMNFHDQFGVTPLMYAIKCDQSTPDFIHYLLDNHADPDMKDHMLVSAWDLAAEFRPELLLCMKGYFDKKELNSLINSNNNESDFILAM